MKRISFDLDGVECCLWTSLMSGFVCLIEWCWNGFSLYVMTILIWLSFFWCYVFKRVVAMCPWTASNLSPWQEAYRESNSFTTKRSVVQTLASNVGGPCFDKFSNTREFKRQILYIFLSVKKKHRTDRSLKTPVRFVEQSKGGTDACFLTNVYGLGHLHGVSYSNWVG